jgi:hypothetical protein
MNRILFILIVAMSLAAQAQDLWKLDLRPPMPQDGKRVIEVRDIGVQWWFENRGILAEESLKVAGYFITARPLAEFSARDDRVWEVRVLHLHTGGPSGVLWVNDSNGKVIAMGAMGQASSTARPASSPR